MEKLTSAFRQAVRALNSLLEVQQTALPSQEELAGQFPHKENCLQGTPLALTVQNISMRPLPGQWGATGTTSSAWYYLTCSDCGTSSQFDPTN